MDNERLKIDCRTMSDENMQLKYLLTSNGLEVAKVNVSKNNKELIAFQNYKKQKKAKHTTNKTEIARELLDQDGGDLYKNLNMIDDLEEEINKSEDNEFEDDDEENKNT